MADALNRLKLLISIETLNSLATLQFFENTFIQVTKTMAQSSNFKLDRVDTLIITVGTRQVGWRSSDGIIRCFGADGDRSHPPHIDQLYEELKIERQYYEADKPAMRWSVRDLGKRYYDHCEEWLGGDFSQVELLLDHKIIEDSVKLGLKHIILWATNQPETIAWNYRRADTLWLAQLMKRKIETTWKEVKVDAIDPMVNAVNRRLIREEFEKFILPFALETRQSSPQSDLVLLIENKGAVPAIAESLEICAAALVREFQVINANPKEPNPLYQEIEGLSSASRSQEYDLVPVSEYFWPLERSRIISAWERGDFKEAQVWLSAHQLRYKYLYQLAGYLSLVSNWEILKFFNDKDLENGWLRSRKVEQVAGNEAVQQWRDSLLKIRNNRVLQTWETIFLISLELQQENYSTAFMQFSQTLERLLYIRSQQENWLSLNLITIPPSFTRPSESYNPSFKDLIVGWSKKDNISRNDRWYKILHEIRNKRNELIHEAKPMTRSQLRSLWANNCFPVTINDDPKILRQLMLEVFTKISDQDWELPQTPLLEQLSQWGLEILQNELAQAQLA
ncbi:hypothetical protein JJD41_01440 [Oxynema sp. CENA135]|uniref:hypothetical protein n=1 Tax=Oxynema sp. CENA135 TaxID=984206 RepID=UPI00190D9449|nr:hypothetical protein [Oxynema sp. CENA135]MBK4728554.1 hypothetical protein [Oxynema sp. CENA135]